MKTLDRLVMAIKGKIVSLLEGAEHITILVDLWTKQDQTPFIGIVASFFNQFDHKRHVILLDLKELPHPHTGENIYDAVINSLGEWAVPEHKVCRVVTDNGSNMVRAFRLFSSINFTDNANFVCSDGENSSSSDDEILCSVTTHFTPDANLDESFDEEMFDSLNLEKDSTEFDQLSQSLESLWPQKQLSCFVHTLQLVVGAFVQHSVYNRQIKTVLRFVHRINMSSKATSRLKQLSGGLKLKKYCATRWSSLYTLIDRLLKVEDALNVVCKEYKIDSLQPSQWTTLSQIRTLLEPFAQHTNDMQASKSTTISLVIPAIKDLEAHLKKVFF